MNSAVLLAIFLLTTLLVAQVFGRWTPLSRDNPLDIDDGLPLPWAGYATSAFSLTGVFAAYLGAFLFIGFSALTGIVFGVIFGLLLIRRAVRSYIETSPIEASFQGFLLTRQFTPEKSLNLQLWIALAIAQLGIAVSEIILFREVAIVGFDMGPKHATALVLSVSLVSYSYCLLGGYNALFRTDVAQFIAMLLMSILLLATLLQTPISMPQRPINTGPNDISNLWTFGLELVAPLRWIIEVTIGFAMGAALLVSTPDTWKRVFISQHRKGDRSSFGAMVLAGALPFLVLAPLGFQLVHHSRTPVFPLDLLHHINSGIALNALLLGMTASFMSTFDSALVSASHLLLVLPRPRQSSATSNLDIYRLLIGLSFAITVILSLVLFSHSNNPYIPGNFLVGPFAILSGYIVGTSMLERGFESTVMASLSLIMFMLWIIYFISLAAPADLAAKASIAQAPSFTIGGLLFLASIAAARWSRKR